MPENFFIEKRPQHGLTYEEFLSHWENEIKEVEPNNLSEKERTDHQYKVLNKQRSTRIHKTYKVSEELSSLLTKIDTPQIWMVLTENWCGDSAQNLPYIAEMAKSNSKIDLRILQRDKNLDIMDKYLTNGKSRSIPKVVAFDLDGNELFQWGPRPKKAQEFVSTELASGKVKDDVYKDLHLWYAKNRGEEIEREFIDLIEDSISIEQEHSQ